MAVGPSVIIPKKAVLFRELDGELILLSLTRGTYFSLDPVGTRIWQLIQFCGGDLRQVAVQFCEEFDVTEERFQKDADAFIASLCEHGLLERVAQNQA